jgi:hypothetical protein
MANVHTINIVELFNQGNSELLASILRCYSHDPEPTPVTTVTCGTSRLKACTMSQCCNLLV